MDNTKHRLDITWSKAFDEVYCHHASMFIPFVPKSRFDVPELVKLGVTVRYNTVKGRKIKSTSSSDFQKYLPCVQTDGGLIVHINSTSLIDALSLNSWTSLKNGKRGTLKEFPTCIFYSIGYRAKVKLPFSSDATPYLSAEKQLHELADGEKLDTSIILELPKGEAPNIPYTSMSSRRRRYPRKNLRRKPGRNLRRNM